MAKTPNLIDVHVGSRVKLRRMLVGMSQEKLGDALGLTFQQVQKYEKGANRIGASRLFTIASILGVPVAFFFDDMPGDIDVSALRFEGDGAEDDGPTEADLLGNARLIRLARAASGLSPAHQTLLADMAEALPQEPAS